MDVCRADHPKNYAAIAKQYAEVVIRGEIVASKWVRLACQRQLDDLKRFKGKDSPYRFNPTLTNKAKRFEGFHRLPKSDPGRTHPYICPAGCVSVSMRRFGALRQNTPASDPSSA